MQRVAGRARGAWALGSTAAALGAAGASLVLEAPGHAPIRVGPDPERARVVLRSAAALRALARRDLHGLLEAHLRGEIDVAGDFLQALKVVELPGAGPLARAALRLRRLAGARRMAAGASGGDRPPELCLPWLARWRSRSYGLYRAADEAPEAAQARKLQRAVDALGLEPGMRVFELGCGWGAFLEYAGRQGIHVHGITRSLYQHRFVSDLIGRLGLPCTVERVDFRDFRPTGPFDGAVCMGTLARPGALRPAARFLARHLAPRARVWAEFRAPGDVSLPSPHASPDAPRALDPSHLLAALARAGFGVWELVDDTRSCAWTCRDQAAALEAQHKALAERFGEREVRALLAGLRASQHLLTTGRCRAYHLVAAREPAPLAWRAARAEPAYRAAPAAARLAASRP